MVVKLKDRFTKVLVTFLAFLFVFTNFPSKNVNAENTIDTIDIKAEIQDDGSVIIKDHRIFYAETGTEHYVSIGNLGDSEIYDYKVFDENGKELENVGTWNVNASLEEKTGKYGINYTNNTTELCFGIGEYGRREFTLQYKVSNFVRNLSDDYQAIYWKFINENLQPLNKATVTITNNKGYEFVYPQTRIWGFGYRGKTEIKPNELIAVTGDNFKTSDYLVFLNIFEGKVFNTNAKFGISSEDLIEKAKQVSYIYKEDAANDSGFANDYNKEYNRGFWDTIADFFPIFVPVIVGIIFTIFGIANTKRSKSKIKMPNINDVEYYREVPYNDFIKVDYITESEVSDIISALIIKWINKGLLKNDLEQVGLIFKKDQLALRILKEDVTFDSSIENDLWDMVIEASEGDGVLSQKEFNSYISRNIDDFNEWVKDISTKSRKHLLENNYLIKGQKGRIFKQITYDLKDNAKQLQRNIVGFKKYLKDFSLLNERGMSESGLWKEYMEWAAYMGIAEEVYDQFKVIDPGYVENLPYTPNTIMYTHLFARSVQNTYNYANSSSSYSSSGGGGISFGGGGGGSFGGGSGGGTR